MSITPQLGLVCITASDAVRYRTVTRKTLLQLSPEEQREKLRELYTDNLSRFNRAIDFCNERGIKLYRLTSALFPFADDEAGAPLLDEMADQMRLVGERAVASGLRVVLHPDQFCVLSSDSPHVIANSIKILETHARIFDLLRQPRSQWATMNIHGGKGDRTERLASVIRGLPDNIRLRLALENDEHAYSSEQILDAATRAGVPSVFDAHHHVCRECQSSYNHPSIFEMTAAARETWAQKDWQLVHISNGREYFNDARHNDVITAMPDAYREVPWIEVEAKKKEIAIDFLRREWPHGRITADSFGQVSCDTETSAGVINTEVDGGSDSKVENAAVVEA